MAGIARLGKFIRLVPRPVMLGFINGLALVTGAAQLETFRSSAGSWLTGASFHATLALTAFTMLAIWGWERLRVPVPGPLVGVIAATAISWLGKLQVVTLGDLANIAGQLPKPHMPQVPLTPQAAAIVLPAAASLAAVGLVEALLAQQVMDELTESRTYTHVECISQGVANVRHMMWTSHWLPASTMYRSLHVPACAWQWLERWLS